MRLRSVRSARRFRSDIVPPLVQALEPRRLLATVNIVDFGATPNDATDDRAAIQAAIDAAGVGGTVIVPLGEFRISGSLWNIGGRTILGSTKFDAVDWSATPLQFTASQASIIKPTAEVHVFRVQDSNVTIRGIMCDGRGVWIERNGGITISNITIDNNWFRLPSNNGDHRSCIEFTTRIANVNITNNVFDPIRGVVGIYGYYWTNLTIANNAFLNGTEGMHLTNHDDKGQNLLIEQNYFAGLSRMGIEYQAGGWNTIVQDNYYEKPAVTANANDNLSTFAYSIVADTSKNTIVRRNVSIAPERPDGKGVRVIFEMGGFNMDVYDNYSVGGNHVVAVNGTNATGTVHDNLFINYLKGPSNANGATVTFANNGPTTVLTWDLNRGKPGPNHRFGHPIPDPDPNPNPDPDPNPQPPPPNPNLPVAPTDLSGATTGLSQIDLTWTDIATNEDGYNVEILADDGVTWLVVGALGENAGSFTMTGLASGKTYSFRVRAHNEHGASTSSNVAVLKMPLPDGEGGIDPSIAPSRRPRPIFVFRPIHSETVLPPIIPDL